MAEKRMFAKSIIDSDLFLDMPMSAQNLYFHLAIRADDEGFVSNPKRIQRMLGVGDDDVKILLAKEFLILFESGVVVVTHWKLHNYIQSDRFKPSNYVEEREQLYIKNNKIYTLDTTCIHYVSSLDTQIRLEKIRKDKISINTASSSLPINPKKSFIEEKFQEEEIFDFSSTNISKDLILEFIEYRKEIKAPMTQKAITLFVKKLEKLSLKYDPRELIDEAVINNWKSIFEPINKTNAVYTKEAPMKKSIDRVFDHFQQQDKNKEYSLDAEIIDEKTEGMSNEN
ncbi:MAG: hypothetical protein PHV08_05890 [Sulfurovaceae bacterium]|nr:hypothetical protein [Sulfurovaceae bacterium]